jgi:hypothetical protein
MPEDTPAPPDLDAIRAQLAAVDGPWTIQTDDYSSVIYDAKGAWVCGGYAHEGYLDPSDPQVQFIIAAPAVIAALLAEVERLRAVLFDTQAWVTHDAECASWRALRCTCEAGPMLDRIYAALDGTL